MDTSKPKKKIFIIAGEASGDYLGGKLMEDIKFLSNDVEFAGIGGEYMNKAGLQQVFSIDQLSIIGIWEVITKIFYIKKMINETVKKILDYQPNVVVTIDFPGFTSRVSKALKEANAKIPIVHYVAPSVWAWRSSRAKDMRNFVDKLLTILPFEPELFSKYGLESVFVGHPVALDSDFEEPQDYYKNNFLHSIGFSPRFEHNIHQWRDNVKNWYDDRVTVKIYGNVAEQNLANKKFEREEKRINMHDYFKYKIITLIPGSRKSEIDYHMPILKEFADMMVKKYSENIKFIIPTVGSLEEHIREYTESWNSLPIIITSKAGKILSYYVSDVAVAASGTVNLELARVGLPSVIIYKTSALNAAIVKRLIKIKYVSLVNILSDKLVLPELLQDDCNAGKIFSCVTELIDSVENRERQKREFKSVIASLIPSDKQQAAKEVLKYLFD
ncbi:MAG: hypothetical protein IJ730_02955 [Alphaproteobacteria bacterium]|nr:hypothetical protein [Alphaproteobacteria bacterium]